MPKRLFLAVGLAAAGILLSVRAQEPAGLRPLPSAGDLSGFRESIRARARERSWVLSREQIHLDRTIVSRSVEAARAYYLSHQKPEGNFVYEHDIVLNELSDDDSQVRQAGALWGLACLNRDRPTNPTARGVIRGLDFWFLLGKPTRMGQIAPLYPGETRIKTGTIALLSLSVIELLRGEEQYIIGKGLLDNWLSCYLGYLRAMEMDNGSWGRDYYPEENRRIAESSPYYDGEALLAYCKAARYAGRKDLIPRIEAVAPILARRYTTEAWAEHLDSDNTKGFFQWGCMAFAEYVEAGWKDADLIGDAAMALAWWQIHEHRVQMRKGNTGYAIEGLLGAYRVARARGDRRSMQRIHEVVEEILYNLITWQVGGPLADRNRFLKGLPRVPDTAFGGVMSTEDSGTVRIDVVQHQVHAMLMALELLYPDETGAGNAPQGAGLPRVPAVTRETEEVIRVPGPKTLPEKEDEK